MTTLTIAATQSISIAGDPWASDGELIIATAGVGEALVIARHEAAGWSGQVVAVEQNREE